MYKKRLLNSAIALALATTGGVAMAEVDIDTGFGVETYAIEPLNIANPPGDGWVNDDGTAEIDVTGELGWSVGAAGAPRFMRFDLYNAVLETPLPPGALTLNIASMAGYSVSISGGGQPGDDFVIFEVTNTDAIEPINNTDRFDLDIDEVVADLPKVTTEIRYRAFETGLISQNATGGDPVDIDETFKDVTVDWFNWGTGFAVSCSPVGEGVIDTIDRPFWEALPFLPAQPRQIATSSANSVPGILNPTDSLPVDFTDYFTAGNALFSVEGNFQGIAQAVLDADQDPNTPPAEFFIPNLPVGAFAPTTAQVVYNGFFNAPTPGGYSGAGLYLVNSTDRDGDTQQDEMVPSEFSIRFAQPAPPATNAADFRLNDVLVPCGETIASGSTDRLDYTANPAGGVNNSLFRLVNPSDTAGPVVMSVINDDGVASDFFPIDEVNGIDSGVLNAGESTAVIQVNEAFTAAQAHGLPAAIPGPRNKLRIEVRGAFGEDAYDGNLKFNLIFDDSDGGGIFPGPSGVGPSGAGLLRVRGQEQQDRNAHGVQIQGFMFNAQGTVIPYNDR